MPITSGNVLVYAFVLWIVGFIWGMIVLAVSTLKQIPSIAYVAKLPAVSVVLIPAYVAILYYLAEKHLKTFDNKPQEGLKFGLTLAVVNVLLDLLVYVILFGSADYFAYLSIWFAYALFLAIPWLVGRKLESV
jgi:hypothetical protein